MLSRKGTFRLRLHYLEPFSPEEFKGRKAISTEARRRIEEALTEILGAPLRPFAHTVAPVRYQPKNEAAD